MHLSENPFGPSQAVLAAIEDEARRANFYPDPTCAMLREQLAEFYDVDPDMVFVGNGIDELVLVIALTLIDPSRAGLTTESTYPVYKMNILLRNAAYQSIPLSGYSIPMDDLAAACDSHTAVVFICNPHNPAGTVIDASAIQQFLKLTDARGIIPVFDEAYAEFIGETFDSVLPAIRCGANAIALRTFSKAYGLAGLRIGYAIGPKPLIDRMKRMRAGGPFCVNRIAQKAAMAALQDRQFVKDVRVSIEESKSVFRAGMRRLGIPCPDSRTNFFLIKVPGNNGEFCQRLSEEHKILTRDTTLFGFPNHIRISMGDREQTARACHAIEEVMSSSALEVEALAL
ncbi:MAG: histidinol-phosphate transaminase [Pyrinomonadaceae bacterium]